LNPERAKTEVERERRALEDLAAERRLCAGFSRKSGSESAATESLMGANSQVKASGKLIDGWEGQGGPISEEGGFQMLREKRRERNIWQYWMEGMKGGGKENLAEE